MNQKLAKKIRKEIYKDKSRRQEEYKALDDGSIICTGLRGKYRKFKKDWKSSKRNN